MYRATSGLAAEATPLGAPMGGIASFDLGALSELQEDSTNAVRQKKREIRMNGMCCFLSLVEGGKGTNTSASDIVVGLISNQLLIFGFYITYGQDQDRFF
jgi:hypothetical protein